MIKEHIVREVNRELPKSGLGKARKCFKGGRSSDRTEQMNDLNALKAALRRGNSPDSVCDIKRIKYLKMCVQSGKVPIEESERKQYVEICNRAIRKIIVYDAGYHISNWLQQLNPGSTYGIEEAARLLTSEESRGAGFTEDKVRRTINLMIEKVMKQLSKHGRSAHITKEQAKLQAQQFVDKVYGGK